MRACRLRFLFAALLVPAIAAAAPRFYPDDPLLVDEDRIDTPDKPAEIELSDLFDRFANTFRDLGTGEPAEAENVNTLDEVPDSSWFTNRHGTRRMSLEELVRGASTGDGPKGTWTVVKTKSQGITPGFQILDEAGDRYVVKLDSRGTAELASSSEAISSRFFHAIGYFVPEVYIAELDPHTVKVKPGTRVTDRFGDATAMTAGMLKNLLRESPRLPNGSIRVLASKFVAGRPIGPFRYHGTRSDDPNDVIAHEDRRELRGLRLLAAWLNHDDTRAQNTLDSWVEEARRHHVRHYLIDFGSTLGSGSTAAQIASGGFQYWLEPGEAKRLAPSFGLRVPEYRKVDWPLYPEVPAVGRFEAERFDPERWKNDYKNAAFVRMTERDAFWAARILMAFTPEEIRAMVKTGKLSDPRAEEHLYRTILERQRACGEVYLNRLNPLVDFRVEGGRLVFANLAEKHGVGAPGARYRARWLRLDNDSGEKVPIGMPVETGEAALELPRAEPGSYLCAEIRTVHERHPAWGQGVEVCLRPAGGGYEVVGIERESQPPGK